MSLLSLLTPINFLTEREKFINSSTYNPQFEYNWDPQEISKYLETHKSKSDFLNSMIEQNIGQMQSAVAKLFQTKIENDQIEIAKKIVQHKPEQQDTIPSEKIAATFKKSLEYLNINYKVEIHDRHGFHARPMHLQSVLAISKYFTPQFETLESTVKHELTHIIRRINWKFNKTKRSTYFLPTEEGLASYIGDFKSDDKGGAYYQHAVEYLATEQALQNSFRDTYNFFLDHNYREDTAWTKAYRHKLGIKDTSIPWAFMKPGMYFYNEQKVKKLNNDEIVRLFVGKISIDDLNEYEKYSGVIDEQTLRDFFDLN